MSRKHDSDEEREERIKQLMERARKQQQPTPPREGPKKVRPPARRKPKRK